MPTSARTMATPLAVSALFAAALAGACSDPGTSPGEMEEARGSARQAAARADSDAEERDGAATRPAAASAEERVEQGRQAYLSSCIACHNVDPAKDGALGPAVAGSSLELLEARVLRGEYPDGYTPRRDTAVMLAMPFLEKQIPAMAAYLAASGR